MSIERAGPKPQPLSAVVTCFDSAATLGECLESLMFCDEIVVLDSGSTDASREIATAHGARVIVEPFKGYSAQKQSAIDHATHDWVLLLDSDEFLGPEAAAEIRALLQAPACAGYRLRRREWLFWRWQAPRSRHNRYLRLFDRRRARMSGHAVHETVVADGAVGDLHALLWHRGDLTVDAKVAKANRYSTLQAEERAHRRVRWLRTRMVLYPAFAFLRYWLLRGHWRAGWAGFIAARVHAFYAFQKYAKHYALQRAVAGPTQAPAGDTDQPRRRLASP